ncbi:retrovirus-related pol polyprotein from transposon TNT 1-94, partial [Tanacetum coccineum]
YYADMNVPANDAPAEQDPAMAPPTRTDDQVLPLSKWVPIGKSNCVLDVQKSQRNPIFLIIVSLLKNTNFFRAFTASSTIPAIYIQQVRDTMCFNSSTGLYSCQLDEQWFNLYKYLLRDALDITPTNDNNPFVALPSSDTIIEYVNTLGYPCTLRKVSAMSVNALYQPWRVILSMINMCLTGKTAGYDRPRHPVLQILCGIIHRSNIDYGERIWEEFVQSIQTFLIDKKNLAIASRGKKKTAYLLIPSVRFTKLIIHHLKTKHNIHPRIGSPLHYSHDENVPNTLRFVGKDGREIFGMPIPDALLIDDIKEAPYYDEYLEHVAKYQQHLDAEHGSEDQGKKNKLVKETPDAPSLAKRAKAGKVTKQRMPKSSLQLVDEFVDESVPEKEPAHDDEEADLQRALELSLKDQGVRTQGPALPVVIRETNSRRIQPLLDVQGKENEKVIDEQAANDLLPFTLQSRRALQINLSFRELALTDNETESDKEVPEIHTGDQDEGQAGPNPGEQDAGQDGPNTVEQDEGQAGSNPGDAAESQPQSSHVIHAGPNLEHMDSEATDVSTHQNPEQIDEEFTIAAYPNELGFTNQFFIKKPQEEEPEKTNTESEVQSMVTVPIHQDTSLVPLMTSLVIDVIVSHPVSITIHAPLPTLTTTTTTITTTSSLLPPPPPQPQQSTGDLMLLKRIGELEQHMADLIQDNLALEERLDKHGTRLYNLENLNIPHNVSQAIDEIVTDMKEILQQRMFEYNSYKAHDGLNDLKRRESPRTPLGSPLLQPPPPPPLAGASGAPGTLGASGSSQLPPPPPPPSTGTSGSAQQQGSKAPSSSKTAASTHQSMAWTTSNTRYESTSFTAIQETSPSDDLMHDDSIPDEHVHLSDDEDSENDHLPKDYVRKDWWKPLPEKESPATHEPAWTIPSSNVSDVKNNWASALYCRKVNKTVLTQADFEGQAYEVVKAFYPDVVQLQFQMEECHKMLTDQKGSSLKLSISKMKAASYLDFGLELLVPEQMWIDDVCTYDISAKYGISHCKIVLRIADFQEHTIAEKDFKNLYPSNFEDLNLLLLQGHLDHLPGQTDAIYRYQLNLTKPGWDAIGHELKHDYTIIESPRAVMFPVDNNDRKIIRFNEIYKFSDGTLTHILEALDYKVKEFKVKPLNPGMNTQFWTQKDVTRSKEFITAIERRLKTRRIYQNMECFVGGRVRDIDYRLLQRTE